MIPAKTIDAKGTRILAKSLYRELRENGYSQNQILALASELIDLVTCDLRGDAPDATPEEERAGWRDAM